MTCSLIWGIVVLLTIACNNFAGLTVQRVALGAIESTVSPAFVAISNSYFTKQEVASRIGIWYSATGLFSMISGVINFGLGTLQVRFSQSPLSLPEGSIDSSIASWKILFLFAGLFTIVCQIEVRVTKLNDPQGLELCDILAHSGQYRFSSLL